MNITEDSFLTDKYLHGLITSGLWTEHGSDIGDFIEEYLSDTNGSIRECWPENNTAVEAIRNWLPVRYRYAIDHLKTGLAKNIVRPGEYRIYRCIRGDLEILQRCNDESFDIGKYWSVRKTIPYGAKDNPKFPIEITVTGVVIHSDIDFVETMRSRMDFINGDIEEEIQLFKGKYPKFESAIGTNWMVNP